MNLNLQEISQILWVVQGIVDPRIGKEHFFQLVAFISLKVYVMGQIKSLAIEMYQYNPYDHSLIKIGDKDFKKELVKTTYGQTWIEKISVNIILTGRKNTEIIYYGNLWKLNFNKLLS